MTESESSLAELVVSYQKEAIDPPGRPKEIRILLPDVDRHYYINLRTTLDPDSDTGVKRDMWMYFPSSHLDDTGWPELSKLKESTLKELKDYQFPDKLKIFNHKNETDPKYGFPFNELGVTFKAISDHNEYFFELEKFKDFCIKDVHSKLLSFFFGKNECPDPNEYDPFLWGIERELIYDEFPNDKMWIYYPLSFRGVFVSILLARIPSEKLEEVVSRLPLIGSIVCERLLSRYTQFDKTSPLLGVENSSAALTLVSTLAAQCQLKNVARKGRTIRFYLKEHSDEHDERSYDVQLGAGVDHVVFEFPQDSDLEESIIWSERLKYFDILWQSAFPSLHYYTELSQGKLAFASAAVMSRNFSHNVGSHALANPKLYASIGLADGDGKEKETKQRLEIFHSYMQGRLDFLARAISKVKDKPEPLFFLNELMSGFFKQGVLLDTLIDDMDFPAERIEFHVHIEKSDTFTLYEWKPDKHLFEAKEEAKEDPVVGIPGGMIGTHALYAFLENILRNAVKYGAKIKDLNKSGKLEIHLQLRKCSGKRSDREDVPAWLLSIWDNVSSEEKCEDIRKYINQPLVDDAGEMNHEGHGIQEMKLCADLLSGDLRFPTDADYNGEKCAPCDEGCEPTEDYHGHVNAKGANSIAIDGMQPIRCYTKKVGEEKRLTYDLLMPIPTLLGVVRMGDREIPANLPDHINYYSSIKELAEKGAHIGILLDLECADKSQVLKDITKFHCALPFRLMVITDEVSGWDEELKKKTPNDPPFHDGKHIPNQRVHICKYNNNKLKGLLLGESNNNEFLGCGGWNATVLQVYDAWLRTYKNLPLDKRWKLCVGFKHGGEAVVKKWKKRLDRSCVDIYVSAEGVQEARKYSIDLEKGDKFALCFINHDISFNGITKGSNVGFYQTFGLKDGLSLYQSLASPPQSHFSFGLFVYSLVESALTKVYILDERVAKSMIKGSNLLDKNSKQRYKAAQLFPLFAFKKGDECTLISSIEAGPESTLELDNVTSCKGADVLLIHEGVMDMLVKEKAWDKENDTPRLFSLAPFVVRTSGRGRESQYLDDSISFLEFNEVSGNTYQEMNKPRLVKSLLGSSGNLMPNEQGDAK